MALYLISRQVTKLNVLPRLVTTQISTVNKFGQYNTILAPVNKALKHEQLLTRSFALSKPNLASAGGDYSTLWKFERFLSLGLLFVLPAAIACPSQVLDSILATTVVTHAHLGLEAIIVDYVRPNILGPVIPKIVHALLILISLATLGGLYYFIYNDIGIGKAFRKLWAIKGQ